ncbi:MAG: hypothetical protein QW478_05195 [Candidatus Micrarchaeaceae archaeon]
MSNKNEEERQELLDEIEENIENLRDACDMYVSSAEDLLDEVDDNTSIEELRDILAAIKEAYMNQNDEILI